MRKILIATPLKGGLDAQFVTSLLGTVFSQIPDTSYGFAFVTGTSVALARNATVKAARSQNCTDILFWDADLRGSGAHLQRLLSHDREFVAAWYSKRGLKTYWHGSPLTAWTDRDPSGLVEMRQCAVGFSLIRMSVFDKIAARYPLNAYQNNEGDASADEFDYFPTGIVGPNSDSGKLDRIRSASTLDEVRAILADSDPSGNMMMGEDYYFCRLAREAGVSLWLDPSLVVAHNGTTDFPIPTDDLKAMIAEPWRV